MFCWSQKAFRERLLGPCAQQRVLDLGRDTKHTRHIQQTRHTRECSAQEQPCGHSTTSGEHMWRDMRQAREYSVTPGEKESMTKTPKECRRQQQSSSHNYFLFQAREAEPAAGISPELRPGAHPVPPGSCRCA